MATICKLKDGENLDKENQRGSGRTKGKSDRNDRNRETKAGKAQAFLYYT